MAVTGTNITLTTRTAKGSALTHAELDANQTGLKTAVESHSHNEFAAALGADDNYMTDAEKTKLAGIASGAEVNVQADWNASTGDAAIMNKPSIPSISGLLNEAAHDALDHTGLPGVPAAYTLPTASTSVLGGVKVDGTTVLISDGVISSTGGGGGGVTDHGLLTGLSDDDHSQYLNSTRHGATDHAGLTGVLAIGTTGTTACAGNDSRLSDPRTPTAHSHAQSDVIDLTTALSGKQATLVSGTNIKTIDGASILGSGNIVTSGSGMTNPMTAAGDMIIGGTGGAPTRLPKGADGQVLTLTAGSPAWGGAPIGGASSPLIAKYIVGSGTDSGTTHYVGGGSAVTGLTISDLDSATDGRYVLCLTMTAVISSEIYVLCNGIGALSQYGHQWTASEGTSVTGHASSSNPHIADLVSGNKLVSVLSIDIVGGNFFAIGEGTRIISSGDMLRMDNMVYGPSISTITSLTVAAVNASAIGVGSVLRIYKTE